METHLKDREFVTFKHKYGTDQSFTVECSGKGRERVVGIAMLWRESLKISILNYSSNHINVEVFDEEKEKHWILTGVHGFPEEKNKRKTWQLIKSLKVNYDEKWICIWGFNDILAENEKQGGKCRTFEQFN